MNIPSTIWDKSKWPPNYAAVYAWRANQLIAIRKSPELLYMAKEYYRRNPAEFIQHWVDTVDPRNAGQIGKLVRMPFIFFGRQHQLIDFLEDCKTDQENGLIEKCRTAGATWTCCAYSVHQWLFVDGTAIGWGSRKEQLVDKIGDMDSIFEKMRFIIRNIPREFLPVNFDPYSDKYMSYMKIVNPENGATITGEAGNNIGRGGRKTIYFKDESAHYERPDLIEASLSENTRVQIDISSVNGPGNVFHRKRESGRLWEPGVASEPGKTRVFIFDVFDHPANTQEWYISRKKKFEDEGLLHIFAQEIDRNYSASVIGTIIKREWVIAARGAHLKLGIKPVGRRLGALDVADGGNDTNAFSGRVGIILDVLDQWGAPDPGATARRAIGIARLWGDTVIQYDSIGVGSGVKTEINRLKLENKLPAGIEFVGWNAGATVRHPYWRVIENDEQSPLNKDYFGNMKAQAWQSLAARFYKTWRILNDPTFSCSFDDLISIDPDLPFFNELLKELTQVTKTENTRLQMIINKTPVGTKSPNLADSVVMNYFPLPANSNKPIFGQSTSG